jgi:tetratricopeptide (TPR) repeat protein
MDAQAQSASVPGNDNIVVQAMGSGVNVTIGSKPHLRLTRYVNQTKLEIQRDSEAAWLSAYRADVVPLIGRDNDKAVLKAWLDKQAPVSVRVLVGAGGRGKTRLALELAREVAVEGWLAGFATFANFDRFRRQNGVEDWRWDKPVLIIIDYAASRAAALRSWIGELVDASFEGRPKLRLLLLERQANRAIGWHATVFGSGRDSRSLAANALLDPEDPFELPPLANDHDFRRQLFGALLKRANTTLEAPAKGTDGEFDRLLGDKKWAGDPLYLMMAGLAAAKAGVKGALALSRADLALNLGSNELERIGRIAAARGVDEKHEFPGAFARHMAAIVTLLQGMTLAEARALAASEKVALDSAAALDATLGATRDALPSSDAIGGVAPILPDVIGEGAILSWFGPTGGIATFGVDSAGRITAAARTSIGKASATLARAAQDFAEAGHVEPVRWLEALAGAPDVDLSALKSIADVIPEKTTALREFALNVDLRLSARLREFAERPDADAACLNDYAETLNDLANSLRGLGRNEEALSISRQCCDLYRRLAPNGPEYRAALAGALNNLSTALDELRQPREALEAVREGSEIFGRLSDEDPATYAPRYAMSLGNLGRSYMRFERSGEAFLCFSRAIQIFEKAAAERPDVLLSDLAMALNNLSGCLAGIGQFKAAAEPSRRSTDIRRRLAAGRPDAFRPELAWSLHNLAAILGRLERWDEALAASSESHEIFRTLADKWPDAFRPVLAESCQGLAYFCMAVGKRSEAVVALNEQISVLMPLAERYPGHFLPELAGAFDKLHRHLTGLGEHEKALAASAESARLRQVWNALSQTRSGEPGP